MSNLRTLRAAIGLTAAALGLAACGGGGGESAPDGPTKTATDGKITVTSDGLNYDVGTIEVTGGKLDVTYVNDDSQAHNFTIRDLDGSAVAEAGATATASWRLEPGETYTFFCSISGHEAQGMKGVIVVA